LILVLRAWRKEDIHSLALAGGASAMAFLFKPVGMASLLATLAWCSLGMGRESPKPTLKPFLIGFIGAGLLLSWPLIFQGQFLAMLDASIFVPLQFSGAGSPGLWQAGLDTVIRLGPFWGILGGLLVVPFAFGLSKGRERAQLLWVLLWFLATLCGVILQRHGRPHYDHPLAVPLVSLIVLSMGTLRAQVLRPLIRPLVRPMVLIGLPVAWLALIAFFGHYFIRQQVAVALQLPEKNREQYAPYHRVAEFLKEELKPEETVYYWSLGYTPYILADRFSPGRLSPAFLTFGGVGVKMVADDLERIKRHPHLVFLLENPQTFPKEMLDPDSPGLPDEARILVASYLNWRNWDFVPLDRADLLPFRLYAKREKE